MTLSTSSNGTANQQKSFTFQNNEDCLETNFRDRSKWNDLPCHLKQASVCKMPVFDPVGACHELAEIIQHLVGKCSAADFLAK